MSSITFTTTPSAVMRQRRTGFTVIELLVVTTIIMVLTAVGMVSYQAASRNARNGKRAADMESLRSALVLYRSDTGAYPIGTDFDTMVATLNNVGYYSSPSITDPRNEAPYLYSYDSDGVVFEVCYAEEPGGTAVCLANP